MGLHKVILACYDDCLPYIEHWQGRQQAAGPHLMDFVTSFQCVQKLRANNAAWLP
jgi:hypothetical protein